MNLNLIKNHQLKTLLSFCLPSIIAMILTSLITVVDGFFAGNYGGADALAAINLGIPIIYLYLGVGLMFSVGGIAIGGIAFGNKDYSTCKKVFTQTILTTIVISFALSLIFFFTLENIMLLFKADSSLFKHFMDYYTIMLFQLPLMIISAALGMFVRGEGKPQYFMFSTVLTLVLNIILDYAFTAIWNFGVSGIAFASLLSTVFALVFILYFFVVHAKVYRFSRFSFSSKVFKDTVLNGFSEFIGEMSLCISMFAYNFVILNHLGIKALTAFSIIGYVSYIFSMIVIGFGQGAAPLISFSFGAREYKLAINIRKTTNKLVFFAGVILFLLIILGSSWYSRLFVKDSSIEAMIKSGIPIFGISFLFSGANAITSFYFTSIGRAKESAVISSARGFVLLLVLIFTLPIIWGITGLWLVAPITEALTFIICLYYIKKDKTVHLN